MSPLPDLAEPLREAAKSSPHWLIYVAFAALSAAGAMLGFQYVGPGERLTKVEARMDKIDTVEAGQDEREATMVRWMCVKSTPNEQRLAGLKCQ